MCTACVTRWGGARFADPAPPVTPPPAGAGAQPAADAVHSYAGIEEADEQVRVRLTGSGLHGVDVLNTLPALMAADGLLFEAAIIGAWICKHGGIRLVLRPVDRPLAAPFGFTLTGDETTDGEDLAAGLWAGLARARDLVARGLHSDSTPGEDGIHWLTGPVDDAPWTDPIPTVKTPVDKAVRVDDGPDPVPPKHYDDLVHPDWPGIANIADLQYRWRGTLWSTTQLTWYVSADPPRAGWPRPGRLLAAWAVSPGIFYTIFHDPRQASSEEDRRLIREMLPDGQSTPRWGNRQYAGGYWSHNWNPDYVAEQDLMLHETIGGSMPLAFRQPERYVWQDSITWERRHHLPPPPRIPAAWVDTYTREIDLQDR